jgi:predicted secreted protein
MMRTPQPITPQRKGFSVSAVFRFQGRRVVADEQKKPHLAVVVEAPKRHVLLFGVTLTTLVCAVIFGAVTLNALAASAAVEARRLDGEVAQAERLYAQQVADVAALENPGRIREAAFELGLVPAGPARHLVLERNLPADGAVLVTEQRAANPDPLKPLLSAGS